MADLLDKRIRKVTITKEFVVMKLGGSGKDEKKIKFKITNFDKTFTNLATSDPTNYTDFNIKVLKSVHKELRGIPRIVHL